MGMFDSIWIDVRCPYCGETSRMECQTKQLKRCLAHYDVGDYVDDQFNFIDCLAGCHSKSCIDFVNRKVGYVSGFGRTIELRVVLDKGVVTGRYEIRDEQVHGR